MVEAKDLRTPGNSESEEVVLSYLVNHPDEIDIVKEEWFLSRHTKALYRAMCMLNKVNQLTFFGLQEACLDSKKFPELWHMNEDTFVDTLTHLCLNPKSYIEEIKEKYILYSINESCQKIVHMIDWKSWLSDIAPEVNKIIVKAKVTKASYIKILKKIKIVKSEEEANEFLSCLQENNVHDIKPMSDWNLLIVYSDEIIINK